MYKTRSQSGFRDKASAWATAMFMVTVIFKLKVWSGARAEAGAKVRHRF